MSSISILSKKPESAKDSTFLSGSGGFALISIAAKRAFLSRLLSRVSACTRNTSSGVGRSGSLSPSLIGLRLAVASFLEVAALLAVADDVDFLIAAFLDELRRDFCTLHIRCADRGFFAVVGQKHFVEGNLVSLPCDAVELLNIQNAVLRDNVLLPTRFYDSDFGHMN